jgi:RNA polymerase sigma-70 factor, ECF subfamily
MTAALFAAPIDRAVTEHRPYLIRFASRRLRDPALVEDVVQDTIVAALQGAAPYAGKASARTWLTGILLNLIADAVRRESRMARGQTAESDAPADGEPDPGGETQVGEPWIDRRDPQRLLEARQALAALESGLAGLPEVAARIVVMREVEGLSNEETARRLGLPPPSVSLALHRARARLRESLAVD